MIKAMNLHDQRKICFFLWWINKELLSWVLHMLIKNEFYMLIKTEFYLQLNIYNKFEGKLAFGWYRDDGVEEIEYRKFILYFHVRILVVLILEHQQGGAGVRPQRNAQPALLAGKTRDGSSAIRTLSLSNKIFFFKLQINSKNNPTIIIPLEYFNYYYFFKISIF